jgi:hypothetical protein
MPEYKTNHDYGSDAGSPLGWAGGEEKKTKKLRSGSGGGDGKGPRDCGISSNKGLAFHDEAARRREKREGKQWPSQPLSSPSAPMMASSTPSRAIQVIAWSYREPCQ